VKVACPAGVWVSAFIAIWVPLMVPEIWPGVLPLHWPWLVNSPPAFTSLMTTTQDPLCFVVSSVNVHSPRASYVGGTANAVVGRHASSTHTGSRHASTALDGLRRAREIARGQMALRP
jgi:hypothetical protein